MSARFALGAAVLLGVVQGVPAHAVIQGMPAGFIEETVVSGLGFPTAIAFAPDGRMFIALKSGVVRVYQGGSLLPTPFVDLSAQVNNAHDRGLLGLTLHPNFPASPYVYLLYTHDPAGVTADSSTGGRVARLARVEADPSQGHNVAMPGSHLADVENPLTPAEEAAGQRRHVVLLGRASIRANIGNETNGRDTAKPSCMTGFSMANPPVEDCIPSDENSHTIGTVAFGVDGSLFAGAGDGSNYGGTDPRALRAVLRDSLAGKILRIDPETGEGLPDNPFFDPLCPGCNRSKVYAMGLRNPFRFTIDPVTNEPYIGDVGWSTWEEINAGKGANFGWPCFEGGVVSGGGNEGGNTTSRRQTSYNPEPSPGSPSPGGLCAGTGLTAADVKASVFAYNHGTDGTGASGGASANGGAFYAGTVYPTTYQRAEFILDYNRRWIRYLTFDSVSGLATVGNFGTENGTGMVQVVSGPDTNLHVVVHSGSGQVRRIRYVAGGNTPPTPVATATPTNGTAPLAVGFSSVGTFDPDAQPLSYLWNFQDGTTSTDPNSTHVFNAAGNYDVTLTVTEQTPPGASRTADPIRITVGNAPPLAFITSPTVGSLYRVGDLITYAGYGTTGALPVDPSQLGWELRLHHNEHIHYTDLGTGSGGTYPVDEHGDDTFFEFCLTVTVPPFQTDIQCVSLTPETTPITLETDPSGLAIIYEDEGLERQSPWQIAPIVGSLQRVVVYSVQQGVTFMQWADGLTTPFREFTVGESAATYTALYTNLPPLPVIDAAPVSGVAPLTVDFSGARSTDPELTPLSYGWTFGDGGTSDVADVTHAYTAPGTYTARLTVTDQRNGSAAASVVIQVVATTTTTSTTTTTTTSTTSSTTSTTSTTTSSTTTTTDATTSTTSTTTSTTIGTTTTTTLPGCPTAPRAGCQPAASSGSSVTLRKGASPARDSLVWSWSASEAVARGDLGAPAAQTSYLLCVYDQNGGTTLRIDLEAPAGGQCGSRPCWRDTATGVQYKDPALTPDGIRSLVFKAGPAGRAKARLKGKGTALALPAGAFAPPLTVQLVPTGGPACWEARYETPSVNAPGRFKARSDAGG